MRAIKLLVLLLALQAAAVFVASAQPVQVLHPTNAVWRYLADGSDQGTAWQAPSFDDTTWPEGHGLFGNETQYPYPMNVTIPGGAPITVYYRSHFTWSGGTFGVVLTGTNYVDDGSVIYLNGVEIARFNMPEGAPLFDTSAPAANPGGFPNTTGGEPALVQLQIPLDALTNGNVNPLIAGDNVVAVEVHQNGTGSSDRVFGLALYGQQAVAPCVDNIEPVDRSITEGRSTTFTVVQGANCGVPAPSFQWYRNVGLGEELIAGATAASYTLNNAVDVVDEGTYYCRLTNPSGSIDSRQAVLTITEDHEAPQFVSARLGGDNMTILVTMNEPVCVDLDGTTCGYNATDAFNWDVINPNNPGDPIGAATVVVNNGTNVVITTLNPWTAGQVYRVLISDQSSGIGDLYGNTMVAFTFIDTLPTVTFRQGDANGYTGTQDAEVHSNASADTALGTLLQMGADLDDAGVAQSLLRFDNIFGNNPGQIPPGALITSAVLTINQIDPGSAINLHRMLVTWDQASATWNSMVNGVTADDVEAAVAIDATKAAGLANGLLELDVTASLQAWSSGQPNHGWVFLSTGTDGWDANTSESGVGSAPLLTVSFQVVPCNTAPQITTQPPATLNVNEGSPFSITVGADACEPTFQWTKDGSDIAGANSTTLNIASAVPGAGGSAGSYRLRITNPNGTVTSDATVVTVSPDTTRPALTRAASTSSTTIVLNFNKALSAATAEDESKYVISGGATVTSAILVNAANSATVTLTTSARGLAASTLTITGVTDNRASANLINPNPTVVSLTGSSIVTGAEWAGEWLYNTNNLDGTPTWKDAGFTPGADWLTGNALFGTETSAGVVAIFPTPIATVIPPNSVAPGDFVTAYFRKTVTLPALSGGAIYILEHFIDDGAIFYMDGVEFARFQMPAGAVQYSTKSTAAGEATLQAVRLPASASAGGTHTIAVEVHQGGATTSSDMLFGAQVLAVSAPPSLSISPVAGGVSVNWNADSSWRLLGANLVEGPYAAVAGNPFRSFTVPTASQTNHFFYLLQFNPAP